MISKQRLCNIIRRNYPEAFSIRKKLQGIKVKRLFRHYLSENEIKLGERQPEKKKEIIVGYLKKEEKFLRPVIKEMEDILASAPQFQNRTDKELLRTDMIFCRLAYGFLPSEYVGFELENKSPEERKEFFSDIDTLAFGYSVNNIRDLQFILDKADSSKRFSKYYKRETLVVEKKADYAEFSNFVKKHPVFVEKEVISSMGKGTSLIDMTAIKESKEEYFEKLISHGKYLLEERVEQDDTMAKFNSSSVNTIRCMTFRTKKGVIVPYCFMRTGRSGSFVDNGGSGGLLIGIDIKSGTLNTDGFDEYNDRYPQHPDSKLTFKGFKIPAWDKLIDLCKTAALEEKTMGFLSWDLAYTKKGWIVIEVNEVGQLIGPQIVMRKGIKSEMVEYSRMIEKVI